MLHVVLFPDHRMIAFHERPAAERAAKLDGGEVLSLATAAELAPAAPTLTVASPPATAAPAVIVIPPPPKVEAPAPPKEPEPSIAEIALSQVQERTICPTCQRTF